LAGTKNRLDSQGIGGRVCDVGTLILDALTVMKKNEASTSNDDLFP
jgi:hypothetical protein